MYHSKELAPSQGKNTTDHPTIYAVCLGPFEIRYRNAPLALCANRNGQAILRYLIAQPGRSATADTLMTLFWPEEDTDIAQRRLQVTISILRRSLRMIDDLLGDCILYKRGCYKLNPEIVVHTDVDAFHALYESGLEAGSQSAAIPYFEQACALYTRPFLMEDLYADWSYIQREHLRQIYLKLCLTLASYYFELRAFEMVVHWVTAIIQENRCNEIAYQLLMQVYACQGRREEALRVYQRCQQILHEDLGMQLLPQTDALYQAIMRGELCQKSQAGFSSVLYRSNIEGL